MRTAQLLHTLLVPLAILPKTIHLIINLLGIERSQLLTKVLQTKRRLNV